MRSVLLFCLAAGQNYEWSGIFATPDASYTWIAQKVGGDYADPTMILVALPASAETADALHSHATAGNAAMAGTCTAVTNGGTITPAAGTCYTLTFDASAAETRFTVNAADAASIAFFAQHFPTEFEKDTHYFQTTASPAVDVEPVAQGPAGFEWYGVFPTPETSYTWIAQKVGGDYADPTMILAAVSASANTEAALVGLEAKGKAAFAETCTAVTNGGTITPADNTCYLLTFDASARETTFTVDATGVDHIAFFGQHFPTEFEDGSADDGKHYLQDSAGTDIEPGAEKSASGGAVGHTHASDYDHGLPCGCEKDEADHPFAIDCADTATIRAAMTTMGSCEKATCKTTKDCQVAFFVLQAHHDYCSHDTLHYEEEVIVHAFENDCTNCQIFRKNKAGNPKCFFEAHQAEEKCKDTTPTVQAVSVLKEKCTAYVKDVSDGECCTGANADLTIGAFATVVAYHDLCDPNDVPEAVEIAFHDYEHQCANHMCNAVDANYDGTTCPEGGVYEFDANGFKSSTPAVDSHAGVATLLVAVLAALC